MNENNGSEKHSPVRHPPSWLEVSGMDQPARGFGGPGIFDKSTFGGPGEALGEPLPPRATQAQAPAVKPTAVKLRVKGVGFDVSLTLPQCPVELEVGLVGVPVASSESSKTPIAWNTRWGPSIDPSVEEIVAEHDGGILGAPFDMPPPPAEQTLSQSYQVLYSSYRALCTTLDAVCEKAIADARDIMARGGSVDDWLALSPFYQRLKATELLGRCSGELKAWFTADLKGWLASPPTDSAAGG